MEASAATPNRVVVVRGFNAVHPGSINMRVKARVGYAIATLSLAVDVTLRGVVIWLLPIPRPLATCPVIAIGAIRYEARALTNGCVALLVIQHALLQLLSHVLL